MTLAGRPWIALVGVVLLAASCRADSESASTTTAASGVTTSTAGEVGELLGTISEGVVGRTHWQLLVVSGISAQDDPCVLLQFGGRQGGGGAACGDALRTPSFFFGTGSDGSTTESTSHFFVVAAARVSRVDLYRNGRQLTSVALPAPATRFHLRGTVVIPDPDPDTVVGLDAEGHEVDRQQRN